MAKLGKARGEHGQLRRRVALEVVVLGLEVVVLELEPVHVGPILAAVLVLGPELVEVSQSFSIRFRRTAIMKCCGFGDARLKV